MSSKVALTILGVGELRTSVRSTMCLVSKMTLRTAGIGRIGRPALQTAGCSSHTVVSTFITLYSRASLFSIEIDARRVRGVGGSGGDEQEEMLSLESDGEMAEVFG